jgi:hypothetical protein
VPTVRFGKRQKVISYGDKEARGLTVTAVCSYYVLMPASDDPRTLRLLDLSRYDTVVVQCGCGRSVEYLPSVLPRGHRVPSTTLVWDPQYRSRCSHCGRRDGFGISLRDERGRGDNTKADRRRVIVPAREWRREV